MWQFKNVAKVGQIKHINLAVWSVSMTMIEIDILSLEVLARENREKCYQKHVLQRDINCSLPSFECKKKTIEIIVSWSCSGCSGWKKAVCNYHSIAQELNNELSFKVVLWSYNVIVYRQKLGLPISGSYGTVNVQFSLFAIQILIHLKRTIKS